MKYSRFIALVPLIAILVWGQAVAQDNPSARPIQPDALVGSIYKQVVADKFSDASWEFYKSHFSKSLRHRVDLTAACSRDWLRHNPDPNLKPFIGGEGSIFSGDSERSHPKDFHIERTETGKNGSARVYVRLSWSPPADKPIIWYVAVVLVPENGHYAVDQVLYLKNKKGDIELSLWDTLSFGCDGARWDGRKR